MGIYRGCTRIPCLHFLLQPRRRRDAIAVLQCGQFSMYFMVSDNVMFVKIVAGHLRLRLC